MNGCSSYKGIELLEHTVRVGERIFAHKIRQQIKTDEVWLGFCRRRDVRALCSTYAGAQEVWGQT